MDGRSLLANSLVVGESKLTFTLVGEAAMEVWASILYEGMGYVPVDMMCTSLPSSPSSTCTIPATVGTTTWTEPGVRGSGELQVQGEA